MAGPSFATFSRRLGRVPNKYEIWERESRPEYRDAMAWDKTRLNDRAAEHARSMWVRLRRQLNGGFDPYVKKYRYIDLIKAMNRVSFVLEDIERDIASGEQELMSLLK